ncbi:MAG: hypothetical protein WBG95_12875 [Sulfitobacter sp.]
MPNPIAYMMLLIWPFVCLVLFRTQSVERAIIWSILGGYLLLPPLAEFNLPLVPAMDKVSIPNLSVLAILVFGTVHRFRLLPEGGIAKLLVILLIFSAVPTVLTNREPILFQLGTLPGQSVRDLGSVLIAQVLTLVPFVVARQFLSSERGLQELLLALTVGAIAYSIPALVEIRLSPQINVWIYGFFQHDFEQTMRAGGFRPIVFLPHSLWLALFICTAAIAAATLARTAPHNARFRTILCVVYLLVLLMLCKSAASIAYGMILVPLAYLAPRRWLVLLATVFALVAVTYPMLRNLDLVPVDAIVTEAAEVNPLRAESLAFRINNEEQLLERAAQKPAFGWSGWGRGLVRDGYDGEILTIPDGRWIIVFGTFGWLGYIAEFGLLALPLILLGRQMIRHRGVVISPYIGGVALILGITLIDMLLNATLTPFTWLMAGAVLGYVECFDPEKRGKLDEIRGGHRATKKPAAPERRTVL